MDLGINLNVEYGELKKIEVDVSLTDQRCMTMLRLWESNQPKLAYVGHLVSALISANLQEVAEELDKLSNERYLRKLDA